MRPGWKAVGADSIDSLLNTAFVGPEGKRFILVAVNLSDKPQAAKTP